MARREKKALQRLLDTKDVCLATGLPVYESVENGGSAEMHPPGFRDTHKSSAEWSRGHRKLNPGATPAAYLASWWHGSADWPTQWVPVYALADTSWKKSMKPEAIKARFEAGEELSAREKKIMLASDLDL